MSETTQETAPTPGPWFIDESDPTAILAPDGDDTPWMVARTTMFCGHGDDEAPANAAHIVKCVNGYPDLVAALKATRQFISNGVEFGYISLSYGEDAAHDTLPAIDAALSREGA